MNVVFNDTHVITLDSYEIEEERRNETYPTLGVTCRAISIDRAYTRAAESRREDSVRLVERAT